LPFLQNSRKKKAILVQDRKELFMSHFKALAALALGLVVFGARAGAQDCRCFRIVSTQAVQIVSLDMYGLMVWSNTVPNPPWRVETRDPLLGVWTNNWPTSPMHTNGSLSRVRVPLFDPFQRWIVAFQPGVTLDQAETLFDGNKMVWQPLAFDSLRMAVIYLPLGAPVSVVSSNSIVKYVELDRIIRP
jgi:hypothetical protein